MKKSMRRIVTSGVIFQLICLGIFAVNPVWAGDCNISSLRPEYYAWSENAGWTNWHDGNACVTVVPTYLAGYVWAENIGWIKLGGAAGPSGSPPRYTNTDQTNYGVNRDSGTGALSGYAWSENAGWINFDPSYSQVTWDSGTRKFDGYAWGENVGWIHFQNASPQYFVKTDPLVLYYRSVKTGIWSETATWNQSSDNTNWEAAAAVPDASSAGTTILNGHTVTVDSAVTTDQTTVASGGTLTVASSQTLTIANGDGADLTVGGTLTNAGALTCADGSEVLFSGASASTFTSSGTTTFKTLTLNKDAAATALNITGTADMTVSTALTVTRGTVNLSGWTHNLLLGGSLSIAENGRWTKHGSSTYCVQFNGADCTFTDSSSGDPQNLGHVMVDD